MSLAMLNGAGLLPSNSVSVQARMVPDGRIRCRQRPHSAHHAPLIDR